MRASSFAAPGGHWARGDTVLERKAPAQAPAMKCRCPVMPECRALHGHDYCRPASHRKKGIASAKLLPTARPNQRRSSSQAPLHAPTPASCSESRFEPRVATGGPPAGRRSPPRPTDPDCANRRPRIRRGAIPPAPCPVGSSESNIEPRDGDPVGSCRVVARTPPGDGCRSHGRWPARGSRPARSGAAISSAATS
jgi:hypothetical protein